MNVLFNEIKRTFKCRSLNARKIAEKTFKQEIKNALF